MSAIRKTNYRKMNSDRIRAPFDYRSSSTATHRAPQGMTWHRLVRGWRYDFLVLLADLNNWMRKVDERFNDLRERPRQERRVSRALISSEHAQSNNS